MGRILAIFSSPRGQASISTRVGQALLERLAANDPSAAVTVRDFGRKPLPHIDEDYVTGLGLPADQRTAEQQAVVALSDALIQELFAADTLVIASGMINFGLPSTLKAWFDHVIRAGATFRYVSGEGVKGLVTGKKVYLVEARGGVYSDGQFKAFDFQEPYLRTLLGFIGLTDVEVINVEGLNLGSETADKAISDALAKVGAITAEAA